MKMRSLAIRFLVTGLVCLACALPQSAQGQVSEEVIGKIREAIPAAAPAEPRQPRKLLIFSKTNGFRHGSIPVGAKAIAMLGEQTGAFATEHTEDDSVFEPEKLGQFDAVLMLNTTGDIFRPQRLPEDESARADVLAREKRLQQSLVDFVEGGKGLAGIHSATDTYHDWDAYNTLMGGTFAGHPWHEEVPIRVLDPDHPLNKVFGGKGFTVVDEIYQFRNDTADPSDRRMLLSLDPSWKELSRGAREDGFYPISWIRKCGQGRNFYCSLGHRDEIYYNPVVMEHYLAGLQYALGDLQASAEPIDVK